MIHAQFRKPIVQLWRLVEGLRNRSTRMCRNPLLPSPPATKDIAPSKVELAGGEGLGVRGEGQRPSPGAPRGNSFHSGLGFPPHPHPLSPRGNGSFHFTDAAGGGRGEPKAPSCRPSTPRNALKKTTLLPNQRLLGHRTLALPAIIVLLVLMVAGLAAHSANAVADAADAILQRFMGEFVTLTPGEGKFPASFTMGSTTLASEKPTRTVTFKNTFAIAKYEMTQELYETIMGKNPSRWKGPRNSVEMTNWNEATDFCRRVTAELRQRKLLAADEVIRLPTEAEWEYGCRAGTTTAYSFGDEAAKLRDHAWFNENAKGEDPPVGRKKPNDWGLYDMHGYIWEWCQDSWHPNYEGAPSDGRAWMEKDSTERVVRGGSWADGADACRCAYRHHVSADRRSDAIGFRCVKAKEARSE